MRIGRLVLLTSAAALATPSAQAQDHAVFIRLRHGSGICAGFCPNFKLWVDASGQVSATSLWDETYSRFQATREQVTKAYAILSRIRPVRSRRLDVTCKGADDAALKWLGRLRPDDTEVRWVDGGQVVSLASCENGPLTFRIAVARAVVALGVSLIDGRQYRGPPRGNSSPLFEKLDYEGGESRPQPASVK